MSEEDPKAPSGAVPPIKRRVVRSAQTAPDASAVDEPSESAETSPKPSEPRPKAPLPPPAPLPAVRVESRPDGRRFMDARAPRRPYEDTRGRSRALGPRRPDRTRQPDEASSSADLSMPRRPERTRDPLYVREPRAEARRVRSDAAPEPQRDRPTDVQKKPRTPVAEARPKAPAVAPPEASVGSPPQQKVPDANAEIALAGAPAVRLKQAPAVKKGKPQTGKEALLQKAREPKQPRRKGGKKTALPRPEQQDQAETGSEEEEVQNRDEEEEYALPKRPSFWQRLVSIFKPGK